MLLVQGYSERRAVKKLAADPKKKNLFPYRPNRTVGYSTPATGSPKREAALWRHWLKVKSSRKDVSILDLVMDTSYDRLSSIERLSYDFEMSQLLPDGLVKNQAPPKSPVRHSPNGRAPNT
jgi:hypothetical protein